MSLRGKTQSWIKSNPYETLIVAVAAFYYVTTPTLFNYIDGIIVGTIGLKGLYPHYPFLYPTIGQGAVFILQNFCTAFKWMQISQLMVCILILIHAIRSVPPNKKRFTTFLLLAYSPILIFQFNIISESVFFSAQILFTSTIIRYLFKNDRSLFNLGLHALSAAVLLYTKHVGILFGGILPLVFLIRWMKSRESIWFKRTVYISLAYGILFLFSVLINFFYVKILRSTEVPLYGRPAMHIIDEAYKKIDQQEDKDTFVADWAAKSSHEDELILQQFILESDDIWPEPHAKFTDYIKNKYPHWSASTQRDYVEQSLNQTYWHYLFSGNPHVLKNFLYNFWKLSPLSKNTSIEKLINSHESFFDHGLHQGDFYGCDFNSSFQRGNLFFVKAIYSNLESLTQFFLWYFLISYFFIRKTRRVDELSISLLVFIFVYTFINTIFTYPLDRYSISNLIALIFIVIILSSYKGRLPKFLSKEGN